MQAMQDKDFDRLFKDKFEGAEIQPSSNLWAKIDRELVPEKKRSFPMYRVAAAVLAGVVGIALLTTKTEKLQLHGHTMVNENAVEQMTRPAASGQESALQSTRGGTESAPLVLAAKSNPERLVAKNNALTLPSKEAVNLRTIKTSSPAPVEEVLVQQPVAEQVEVVTASADVPEHQDEIVEEAENKPRKGIRNAGDVINFLVDKFDKREKKIIQFKTDDDDNSSLIAVNIGILKFNPKRNKQN